MKKQRVNLGGDRLGTGNEMDVTLSASGRSTHDLSRIWRSSGTAGTVVPFLVEPILPGDTAKIRLNSKVFTHPTTGPLFGYFKMQMDIFKVPMRYYMAPLHNNYVEVGNHMDQVFMPQFRLTWQPPASGLQANEDILEVTTDQVAPDSIMAYMGVRGVGRPQIVTGLSPITREFNAIPLLAMADIYKQYYANLQEGVGAIMSAKLETNSSSKVVGIRQAYRTGEPKYDFPSSFYSTPMVFAVQRVYNSETTRIYIDGGSESMASLFIGLGINPSGEAGSITYVDLLNITEEQKTQFHIENVVRASTNVLIYWNLQQNWNDQTQPLWIATTPTQNAITWTYTDQALGKAGPTTFDLKNIDNMRMALLKGNVNQKQIVNQDLTEGQVLPYSAFWGSTLRSDGTTIPMASAPLNGLFIKTQLADRFQNWLRTDFIDGPTGITQSSAIDVSGGLLTMDALNLAQKTYELLNRIVAAGSTYSAFLKGVWNVDRLTQVEMPMYIGGTSGLIGFDEVVSTAEVQNTTQSVPTPLGSLAGRGNAANIGSDGVIKVSEDEEPGFIIGVVSLTPQIDYFQGNEWWTRLKTIDELHKPQYDGIGFQELITDEIAAWDTTVEATTDGTPGAVRYRSAGKQPAWIQYQTAVNKCYGNFARRDSEMFMTLTRIYEGDTTNGITNLTTYIDPAMFLQAFATSNRADQPFWIQIAIDMDITRAMSATAIPNL